jgi:hypothetical protein
MRLLTVHGETRSIEQWAVVRQVPAGRIRTRLHKGWSVEAAVLTPPQRQGTYVRPLSMLERFEAKVTKTNSCWLWTGAVSDRKTGRGVFSLDGEQTSAARAAWVLYVGPIPDGKWVLHNCPGGDNPACVNPRHLKLGDHEKNTLDAVERRQIRAGERHGMAKLTEPQVQQIRLLVAAGHTQTSVAQQFSVSRRSVGMIASGERWKCVPIELLNVPFT